MSDISKEYIKELIGVGASIIEIGSYDAKDGAELAEICDTKVHCFEPNPASYEIMKFLNNDRLILWNYAVCSHNGFTKMNLSNHPQSDTIKTPKLHKKLFPGVIYNDVIEVRTTTLDRWNYAIRGGDQVDFIWCDVNGAEADFILGAHKTLSKTRYLYIEFCEKELFAKALNREQMKKALPGFEVIGEYNFLGSYGNLLFRNKNFPNVQENII